MSLATEEPVTKKHWRSTNGAAYTSQILAEINSITHITGFVHDAPDLAAFLKKMVTHYDLREWLLGQIADQAYPKVSPDEPSVVEYLPSKLTQYYDKCTHTESTAIRIRELGIRLEQDGYRLIKL